jgi:hypothetical protein
MSRAIGLSWVADRHCADIDNDDWWLGNDVEEPGRDGDRGGTDRGVEDDRGVEVAAPQLDRTGAGATGRPGCGGAQGGTGCRGGGGVEEPATPGCSWTGAVGGRISQGGGGQVPTGRW